MNNRTLFACACGLLLLGMLFAYPQRTARAAVASCELSVLSTPGDPYAALAQEIAAAENAALFASIDEALGCHPQFLLWVAAPETLTDAVMVNAGLALQDQEAAVGIITGSTRDLAQTLWARGKQVRPAQWFAAVNAANPAAHIHAGRIFTFSAAEGEELSRQPLTLTTLARALIDTDYLTFTGHGAGGYLRLDEQTTFTAADVPALDGVVVSTGSCQTVRPWKTGSIALAFVDRGAAAYAGFVFSPNEGYLVGEFDGLPLRYTWPGFPIGQVLALQTRGTLQGFAAFPFHFLLGDPRIALGAAPPYKILADTQVGERRVVKLGGVPPGVVPIRIDNGAGYSFVRVSGVSAAADSDPFYNSRLQLLNRQRDKYILIEQAGGALTLELRRAAPWPWLAADLLLDSLDDALIYSQQTGGDVLSLAFSVLPLAWLGWAAHRRRFQKKMLIPALGFGMGAALLHGLYLLLRLDQVTITSKAVALSPFSLAATFLLAASGAVIFLHAQRWAGRAIALLVVTFSTWSVMVFGLGVLALGNLAFFRPQLGTNLYNYSLGLLPVAAFLCTLVLNFFGLFWLRGYTAQPKQPL